MSGISFEWLNGHWVDLESEEYMTEWHEDRDARYAAQRIEQLIHDAPIEMSVWLIETVFANHRNPIRFAAEQRGDYIALAAKGKLNVPQEEIELALGRSVSIAEESGNVGILIHPRPE